LFLSGYHMATTARELALSEPSAATVIFWS
jgi:hypothetical protein